MSTLTIKFVHHYDQENAHCSQGAQWW
jgi:hypothetical protein